MELFLAGLRIGTADRRAGRNDCLPKARQTLCVTGHLHRDPLTRDVFLSGPADDFQRSELVRLMNQVPGVAETSWSNRSRAPLIVEGLGVAALGFLFGLLLAYLFELRRRYNTQWNW